MARKYEVTFKNAKGLEVLRRNVKGEPSKIRFFGTLRVRSMGGGGQGGSYEIPRPIKPKKKRPSTTRPGRSRVRPRASRIP